MKLKRKKRLLYTGLALALFMRGFTLFFAAGWAYTMFAGGLPFVLACLLTLLCLGACAIGFLSVRPLAYIHDLALSGPEVVEGSVSKTESREVSDATSYYVQLVDGTRFEISWFTYRKLRSGDSVRISYYPNTKTVTDITKVAAGRISPGS